MIDHSKRLSEPLRWTRGGRVAVAIVALALAIAVGVGVALSTSGGGARAGCIEVTFASSLGGATIHACGRQARQQCGALADSVPASAREELARQCRRAGFPYGGAR